MDKSCSLQDIPGRLLRRGDSGADLGFPGFYRPADILFRLMTAAAAAGKKHHFSLKPILFQDFE